MKSKMRKKLIAFMLCMVLVICNSVSILADAPAAATTTTEKQVKETGTAKSEGASKEDKAAGDEEKTSKQSEETDEEDSDQEEAPEVKTTEKKKETAGADTEKKEDKTDKADEVTTEAADKATTAAETNDKDDTDAAKEEGTTKEDDKKPSKDSDKKNTEEVKDENKDDAEKTEAPTELTYEDSNVIVNVSAEAGIIPENAELSVTPIVKKTITADMSEEEKAEVEDINAQYTLTEKKLNEDSKKNETTMEGFLAYDISFIVDGEEVEPNGDVKVAMDFKEAAIPEGVSENASVEVKHLKEDTSAADGVIVEDMSGKSTVQTTDKSEIEKVEMKADSFSIFMITWTYSDWWSSTSYEITVHYVDSEGNEITNVEQENVKPSSNDIVYLSNYVKDLTERGYKDNPKIKINDIDGTSVQQLKMNNYGSIQYRTSSHDSWKNWLTSQNRFGDIYIIYEESPYDIKIVDDVVQSGCLKVELSETLQARINNENEENVKYVWYKSVNGGKFEEVELKRSGTKNNFGVDENGNPWLNIAIDEGALGETDDGVQQDSVKYEVAVIIGDDDGDSARSVPYYVAYWNELQNGSFETPVNADISNTMTQYSLNSYLAQGGVWKTTGLGSTNKKTGQDIEILATKTAQQRKTLEDNYWWNTNTGEYPFQDNRKAYRGDQFAELNCEASGALYQDVLTIEGENLNYWLAHRARGNDAVPRNTPEYDTMYVVIMPTSLALTDGNNGGEVDQQDEVKKYLNMSQEELNRLGVYVQEYTSDDQSWHYYEGNYVAKASLTRFFFVAGATASNDVTIGNFLDYVGFSQKLPPAADDEFSLVIRKKFEGLDESKRAKVKENIKFKISATKNSEPVSDQELEKLLGRSTIISGTEMSESTNGDLYLQLTQRQIAFDSKYEITVTELNADLDGYGLTTNVQTNTKVGEDESDVSDPVENNQVTVTITGQTTAYITFTNTYDRSEKKNVTFNKVWDDNNNEYETRPNSLDVTLKATILVTENGETVEKDVTDQLGIKENDLTRTLPEEGKWKTTWENVPVYYDYTYANGETVKTKIHYSMVEGEEGEINSVYEYKAGVLQSGSGEDYIMKNENNQDIVKPITKSEATNKALKAAAANSAPASTNVLSAGDETKTEDLGTPNHNKYIEYNENIGEYTLNLDVTGAKGEASGVDVLFVIDTSGSMDGEYTYEGSWDWKWQPGLLEEVQDLLTEEDGIIDQIFEGDGNVNSVAYISFAGKHETRTSGWYNSGTKENLKASINRLEATGGTNWTYAMQRAESVLSQRAGNDNEKVVIFLSDGEPTYSIKWGTEYGHGNYSDSAYYNEAIAEVTGSENLKEAQIYSVYLNDETKDGMKTFADGTGAELKDGNNLSKALTDILKTIIPEYTNVVITDTLSQYVDFACTQDEVVVTKKTANGRTTTLNAGSDYTIEQFGGKTIKVKLLNGDALDDGATYTVSFKVKPNETANNEYANENGYPDGMVGEAGTGATSEDQPGFYSNDSATVTYKINGSEKDESADYPKPVVQVTTHNLTFQKIWEQPKDVETPVDSVTFDVTFTDGTTDEVAVSENDHWISTLANVPINKKILQVTEKTELNDYTSSAQVSSDGLSATVTNTYSKLTTQSITVQKKWENDNSEDRPDSIQVVLYQSTDNGEAHVYESGGTVTLNADNHWNHTWSDLPQTAGHGDNLVTYSYAVREMNTPIGYSSSISYTGDEKSMTATITNTYDTNCKDEEYYIANVLQTENLTVNKTWDDDGNTEYRPEKLSTTVNVTAGNKTDSYNVDLTGTGGWQKTITVPKLAGDRIYSAEEYLGESSKYTQQGDESIEQTANGCEIFFVNELNWDTVYTSFVVKKVWNDDNAADRPGSVNFKLQRRQKDPEGTWEDYGSTDGYNLSKDNTIHEMVDENKVITSWAMEFTNLPAGYEYRVSEETIDSGYQYHYTITSGTTQDIDGKDIETNIITNTLNWSLKKTNSPEEGENAAFLEGAEFKLEKMEQGDSTTLIATGTSDANGMVIWEPQKIDSSSDDTYYDVQNLNGTYVLTETKAPSGYQLLKSASWTLTFDNNGMLTNATGSNDKFDTYISNAKGTATDGIVVTLKNDLLYELPSTGGSGIYWYTLSGTLLMAGAALIVYRQKRKREVLLRK